MTFFHLSSPSYPRLNRESLLPLAKTAYRTQSQAESGENSAKVSMEDWYPPGHGDFYASFVHSGLAKRMIDEGKEWVFVSNIDNLGATIDLRILFLAKRGRATCGMQIVC